VKRDWRIVESVQVPSALRAAIGGHPIVARLLAQRGFLDAESALAHMDPQRYAPAPPWALPGMEEAVRLLSDAIASRQRVRIWGDFDADGVTATAVLLETLEGLGAQVDYRLPSRREGHGLPMDAIEQALADGISLLITCDTGIAAQEEIARAVGAGLRVIVTDHHDLPQPLPPAQAILNPKMLPDDHPLRGLTGVGVAYKLAEALLRPSRSPEKLERLLDLVAIGLVADVATQVRDVRYLIQRGLVALRQTDRVGLLALLESAGLDGGRANELQIGYELAPRLNAAGRLDDAGWVVRLLVTDDPSEAQALAQRLEALNRERQARTEALEAHIEARLERDRSWLDAPALIVDGEEWEPGVLGLVAGRLAQRYAKPAILIAHRAGLPSVASARSVEGIDIHAAIASQSEHLLQQGGHPMAAGLSMERQQVDRVRQGILAWLAENAPPPEALPEQQIDAVLPWPEVNARLAREVERLRPFGPGHPRPVFMLGGATLIRSEGVSRVNETRHRRLYVNDDEGRPLTFVWFYAQALPEVGERIDLACHIGLNMWRGQENLQLELVDWRPALSLAVPRWTRLVAGREVVDWRLQEEPLALARELQAMHGSQLCIWAEGLEPPLDVRTATRAELPTPCHALAILTAPPGADVMSAALDAAKPSILYLLPPIPLEEITPERFLEQVGGMLRVALRRHEGWLDTRRMAARIGARQAAVIAALRGLEAAGKVVLAHEGQGLRAYLPDRAPAPAEREDEPNPEDREPDMTAAQRLAQARAALAYQLRETRAFRKVYAEQSLDMLVASARD